MAKYCQQMALSFHCILGLSWFCMSVEQIFQQVQLYTKGQGGISSWILCISYHLLKRFLYGFYFWMDQVSWFFFFFFPLFQFSFLLLQILFSPYLLLSLYLLKLFWASIEIAGDSWREIGVLTDIQVYN